MTHIYIPALHRRTGYNIASPPPGSARQPERLMEPVPAPLRSLSPEYEAFCRARQVMNHCWAAWVATSPDPADLQDELDALLSVPSQLRQVPVPA